MNNEKMNSIYRFAAPIMKLLEDEDPYIRIAIDSNEVRTVRVENSIKKTAN